MDAEIEQSASTNNNTTNNAHISKRYIYLGLKPVALIHYDADNKAHVAAIHTDYLGTPQAITNEKQQVVWRAEYTPFGKTRNQQAVPLVVAKAKQGSNGFISTANATTNNQQASFTFNLRFAGQYADSETGYYYNWHRHYNPETGRYLTPDPIGLKGGLNAYAYANHDPAMSVDPWGLAKILGPKTFSEFAVWNRKYKDLIFAERELGKRIGAYCGEDKKRLQEIFDNWVIFLDPNIEDVVHRNRIGEAYTEFETQRTEINFSFFTLNQSIDTPSALFVLTHEFRHLMKENDDLYSPSSLGEAAAGNPDKSSYEKDADDFATNFPKQCTCEKK